LQALRPRERSPFTQPAKPTHGPFGAEGSRFVSLTNRNIQRCWTVGKHRLTFWGHGPINGVTASRDGSSLKTQPSRWPWWRLMQGGHRVENNPLMLWSRHCRCSNWTRKSTADLQTESWPSFEKATKRMPEVLEIRGDRLDSNQT